MCYFCHCSHVPDIYMLNLYTVRVHKRQFYVMIAIRYSCPTLPFPPIIFFIFCSSHVGLFILPNTMSQKIARSGTAPEPTWACCRLPGLFGSYTPLIICYQILPRVIYHFSFLRPSTALRTVLHIFFLLHNIFYCRRHAISL